MYAIWHEFNLDVTPLLKMNAACMKRINEIQGNKSLNKKKKKKSPLRYTSASIHDWKHCRVVPEISRAIFKFKFCCYVYIVVCVCVHKLDSFTGMKWAHMKYNQGLYIVMIYFILYFNHPLRTKQSIPVAMVMLRRMV